MLSKDIDYIPHDGEIEELRKRVADIRETPRESLRQACNDILEGFVYNSVNIAGTRLSRTNTVAIIKASGEPVPDAPRATLEVLGLRDAYAKIPDIAFNEQIALSDIATLHSLLHVRIDAETAGHCRPDTERRNYEAELLSFLDWLNGCGGTEPFPTAATAYRRYIYMHPFKGGNGHLARLVLALTMLRQGFPPIIIPNKWKAEYDNLIKNFDEETFANFLKKCSFFTMNIITARHGGSYSDRKTRHIRGINPESDILEHIRQNPGVKSIEMKKSFPKISYTKMTRIIRALRESGKIEFKGATKSGGYYAAEG